MTSDPAALQLLLNYQFQQPELLIQALTHRSYAQSHNERLEYLGDSILGFIIAAALYQRFPTAPEGDLTRMRSRLVREPTLASLARELNMGEYLYLGGGECQTGGYERDSILADSFEAILGAVFLDGGMPSVKKTVHSLFAQLLQDIKPEDIKDPKTRLQETLQRKGATLPVYQVAATSGKPHSLRFKVACTLPDTEQIYYGEGNSKRHAEQAAASCAVIEIDRQ